MVRVDIYAFSDWCDLTSGVPQGGILSQLLFSIFINLIASHIACSYHLYAYDLQLYGHSRINDLDLAIAKINEDLNRISAWSRCFGISVNPSKCHAIVLRSPRLLSMADRLLSMLTIASCCVRGYSCTTGIAGEEPGVDF